MIQSCRVTKLVPEGELLLNKNKIKLNSQVSSSAISSQIKHRPNRRLLLLRFHLWAYQVGLKKIGEPPVVLDTLGVTKSAQNISLYLFKKGFYNNKVDYKIKKTPLRKRANVTYLIDEGEVFQFRKLQIRSINSELQRIVEEDNSNSYIKSGAQADYDLISAERNRINNLMRQNGYFLFNRSLIDFELDTSRERHKVDVVINIVEDIRRRQNVYHIGEILTEIETSNSYTDTIINQSGKYVMNGMDLRTRVLERSTALKQGQRFKQSDISTSYERLIGLGLFQSVDIQMRPREGLDSLKLDVYVRLVSSPRHDLIWEPQLVATEQRFSEEISSRNYGLANEITLKNKNVFHNGEEFNIRLRTALETQFLSDSNSAISTFIQEVNTELKFPHLLFVDGLSKKFNSRTNSTRMSLSYLYERNQFYTRNLLPLTYSYQFAQDKGVYYWTPILISLNKATFDPQVLSELDPSYLAAQERLFTNNLITSHKFSGVLSNREKSPARYSYLNANFIEVAGLFLPQLSDYGDKLGVKHSTFVRTELDYRFNRIFNQNHALVLRTYGGIGVPIGKRSILPYERRFFAGGSNSLRAWRLRTVGPGSFSNDTASIQFARSGELGLSANVEYRFGIIEAAVDVEGALFIDAGNVWNLRPDALFSGGHFTFEHFYKEFAINTGLGIRLDFDFLLLRFDWGIPLQDPNEKLGERWVFKDPLKNKWLREYTVWNVAVGYPF